MKEGLSSAGGSRRGATAAPAPAGDEAGEEARRLQQLDYVRQTASTSDLPARRRTAVPGGPVVI